MSRNADEKIIELVYNADKSDDDLFGHLDERSIKNFEKRFMSRISEREINTHYFKSKYYNKNIYKNFDQSLLTFFTN